MKPVFLMLLLSAAMVQACRQPEKKYSNPEKYAAANKQLMALDTAGRIVLMGNSITELWLATDPGFFKDARFVNRGISGEVTGQMLIRFRPDVIDLKPRLVVILAGINDIAQNKGATTLSETYGNIISMVELARINNIKVIVSSVLPANRFAWRPGIKPAEQVITLNSMLQRYCRGHNIVYLDYYRAMVDDEQGLDPRYTEDGVHPNLEGYKVMEPLLLKAVDEALSRDY